MENLNSEVLEIIEDKEQWLTELMTIYGVPLTNLAFTYTKDLGTAQEIVQDVFITCYEQFHKRHSIRSYKAWIYRITINRAKDYRKTAWFKRIFLAEKLLENTSASKQTEMSLIKQEQDAQLADAVLSLPEKYRIIIVLYYYENLTVKDISSILNRNENTIKTRLKRGRD